MAKLPINIRTTKRNNWKKYHHGFQPRQLRLRHPRRRLRLPQWQEELDQRKKQFETRYGIILGSKVRLILRGENTPLEGIIGLCDSNEPAIRSRLHLRMGKREFILAEIESVMRL